MYHVVVGVDEEEEHARRCVEEVVNLPGESSEKRVTLVHSFVDNPSGASATQVHSVREASEMLEAAGIEYEVEESSGDPADVIVSTADDVDADLVIVGGRKRSPAGKALFGSVTQSVILGAARPVMVTGVAN
ncbi:universal stress protein uspa-like protein [Halogeometricum pallidum JCM 14848]|uniref:Universal stress protein uspa-like protein n=1 Tax=Halogeometricum pallidum JCM 14848 TaxID=1227487 RepID=M0CVK5_HALPD|nr:universal stress protein [Halogeometricum pallidum]ELZ26658.1 universal stress protein uspa-like protein [Halogeometricum pallidum JCM 14848]